MPSLSLQAWIVERSVVLDDMENAHRTVRGSGAGARAVNALINQAYALMLSAQFQGFCRDLHSECAEFLVLPVTDPNLQQVFLENVTFARKIDRGNPNPGNIGSDFSRLGLNFWGLVDIYHAQNPARKLALEDLNEWRNAIAHEDFAAPMLRAGRPILTLAQVQGWRRACDGLAKSFDDVLRVHIRTLIGRLPW